MAPLNDGVTVLKTSECELAGTEDSVGRGDCTVDKFLWPPIEGSSLLAGVDTEGLATGVVALSVRGLLLENGPVWSLKFCKLPLLLGIDNCGPRFCRVRLPFAGEDVRDADAGCPLKVLED